LRFSFTENVVAKFGLEQLIGAGLVRYFIGIRNRQFQLQLWHAGAKSQIDRCRPLIPELLRPLLNGGLPHTEGLNAPDKSRGATQRRREGVGDRG